jgi:signal peptide peptidase SppA
MKLLDIMTSPWMIRMERLREIQALYLATMRGDKVEFDEIEARIAKAVGETDVRDTYEVIDGVAVIEIAGVITKRSSFFSFFFGGAASQEIAMKIRDALDNGAVKAILLNIDSPGGTVDGTQDLAELIHQSRGIKPIVSYTDGMMASAAYYIGAAAGAVYISGDTADIGSIGVVMTHLDYSKADEMHGYKETDIYAGKYKRIVSGNRPLSDEGRNYLQEQVDYVYSVFVQDVARYRGVSVDEALEMADGKIFIGKQAIEAGLVDGVSAFDRLVQRMAAGEAVTAKSRKLSGKETIMDLKELKEKHSELYTQVLEEGSAAGRQEGEDKAKDALEAAASDAAAKAIEAERKRIIDIKALAIPGHEDLIEQMISDGTSAAEAAIKLIQAENALRAQKAEEFAAGGPKPVVEAETSTVDGKPERVEKDPRAEVDRRVKAKMKENDKLTYRQGLNAVLKEDPELAAEYEGRK